MAQRFCDGTIDWKQNRRRSETGTRRANSAQKFKHTAEPCRRNILTIVWSPEPVEVDEDSGTEADAADDGAVAAAVVLDELLL